MAGIGGDGGGDTGGYGVGTGFGEGDEGFADAAFGTEGLASGFSGSAGTPAGLGTGTEGAAVGALSGPAADVGPGTVGPGTVAPVVSQVSTQTPEVVKESPKVEEAKADVKRKARRRSILAGEEGGLEPTNIFRRSILGS